GMQLGAYTVPYLGTAMFVGGPAEAALRGKERFIEYAKEEPFEVGLAAAFGVGKAFKFLGKPIRTVIKEPTVTAKAITRAKVKGIVPKARFLMEVKRGEGIYAVQRRWQTLLGKAPTAKQITRIKPQVYWRGTPEAIPKKYVKGFGLRGQPLYTLKGRLVPTKRLGEPVIVGLRKGARQLTFYRLGGRGRVITKADWGSLTISQKKSLGAAAKEAGWTGKGKLYDFLRGKEVSVGGIEAQKFLKISRTKAVEPVGLQVKIRKG
ncbi:unnamed protein product, partial [marine sediment metagenome]